MRKVTRSAIGDAANNADTLAMTNATNVFSDMADDLDGLDAPATIDETTGQTVRATAAPLVGGHPFEVKGLGLPPFRCTSVDLTTGQHCAYCGTAIKFAYSILSFDRKGFVVGSECVLKTGATVDGFAQQRKRLQRDQRAASNARRVAKLASEWRSANPELALWVDTTQNQFALDMRQALVKWGSLTAGQSGAVVRWIEGAKKLAAIKVEQAIAAHQRVETAQVIDIAKIATAFATAKSKGLRHPKLSLAGFKFKPAPDTGKNPGAIYVTQTRNDEYLGLVRDGKFVRSRQCSEQAEREVLEVCNDPAKAAEAYGRLTGNCAVCSRPLTNKQSVARAIGPICAEKFGW